MAQPKKKKNGYNGKFYCFLFMVILAAYGSSWASGPIGAIAASLHHSQSHSHSNARSKLHLPPTLQLEATSDPSLTGEARGGTYILVDTSRVCHPLSHNGNSPDFRETFCFQTVVAVGHSTLTVSKEQVNLVGTELWISERAWGQQCLKD